jgi:N6-adenosine-specific RNA methylase IME4
MIHYPTITPYFVRGQTNAIHLIGVFVAPKRWFTMLKNNLEVHNQTITEIAKVDGAPVLNRDHESGNDSFTIAEPCGNKNDAITLKPIDLTHPRKKYSIIYADPPWFYNPRRNSKTKFGKGASGHYPLIKTEDIKKLPVSDLAEDNAALFLWVPCPHLKDGIEVLEYWGFTYITVAFCWVKTNKKRGTFFFGTGYYTKSNAEVCLLGIRGRMKPVSNKVSSLISSPISEHSGKPSETRDRIVELFGDLPRIELFSRHMIDKWDEWGNQVNESLFVFGFEWSIDTMINQSVHKKVRGIINKTSEGIDSLLTLITNEIERSLKMIGSQI